MEKIIDELRSIADRLNEVSNRMNRLSCDRFICGCIAKYIEGCIIPELEYVANDITTKED